MTIRAFPRSLGPLVLLALALTSSACFPGRGGLDSLVGRNVTLVATNYVDGGLRTIHLTSTGYIEVTTSGGMSLTVGAKQYDVLTTPNAKCIGHKPGGFGDIGYTFAVCEVTRSFSATGRGESSGQLDIRLTEGDLYYVEENISQSCFYRLE